ncbi:MAG: hypothetical protein QOK37_1609 [Thermoanaerobaculia bacterium]|jgi:hypothetical protein|nr:hypothetical protein [Thermoanaerobaculia bacterium]
MKDCARFVLVILLATFSSVALFGQTTYFFKGDPADQANKVANDTVSNTIGTATFDTSPPTGTVPVVQTGPPSVVNADYVGNPLSTYWSGPYSGGLTGTLHFKWYWSTTNPDAIVQGAAIQVSVFADPDYAADRAQPQKLIGRVIVPLTGIGAAPTLIESDVPVNGNVSSTLLIQVIPQFVNTGGGIFAHYNSVSTPSSFVLTNAQRIPFPSATPASGQAPRFSLFTPSAAQLASGLGTDAGEPSIGANWISGNVLFQSFVTTFRVSFDDSCPTSPTSTWVAKQSPITGTESMDPILWTDSKTGRTIVSQLILASTESLSAVTDNDGDLWLPSQGAGIASGIDHQTVGGGPFHAPLLAGAFYPNAVYYCSQDTALANCALSLDGGLTYGPAVPIYTSQCGGLHGHVKVGPDGVAYVPNKDCGGKQGLAVSEDNGMTWNVRTVPNSLPAGSDPSLGVSKNGRVYFGFADNDNHPVIAISDDHGQTWHDVKDVGAAAGINNVVFSEVVAGDDNRAAYAFLGAKSIGALDSRPYPGVWYMYVATTYDGGSTWHLTNATPNDPVQRGPIWLNGGSEISRNLLDFNDMTVDKQGRMLVGYADGCVDACIQAPETSRGNSYTAVASILRQTGGRRMFAEFDPAEPTAPGAPTLTVTRNGSLAKLSWSEANNGGSVITNYSVRRNGVAIASTTATSYTDPSASPSQTYTYSVVATNAVGSSCGSNAVTSNGGGGSSCTLPGIAVMTDPTADGAAAAHAALDIQSVSIAEPYYSDGSKKLVFTMKVASLASVPAGSEWRMLWNFPTTDSGTYYVEMNTDPSGVVSYEYGTIDLTDAVVTAVGQPHPLGTCDAESTYSPDGTIRLVISTSNVGNAVAGDVIGGLLARTFVTTGSVLTTSRTAIDTASTTNTYLMVGNGFCAPPTLTTIEDDDSRIAYSNGWHLLSDGNASAGHFRMGSGKATASLAFTVPANQFGSITFSYAKSTKGGTAEMFLDGVSKGTISFSGPLGTLKNPQFGFSQSYAPLQPGSHTLEIRGNGTTYLDNFVLQSSSSNAQPSTGPGTTTASTSNLTLGQELITQITLPANAQAISIIVEAPAGMLVRAGLADATGLSLATADTSSSGVAVINQPVTHGGIYLIKTINLSAGPVSVWTVTTPLLTR